MPSWLGLTIAGSWCSAHLKTISFQSSKITNCFIASKTFPPLFVVKTTAPIHARGCDAGAVGVHLFIYMCRHRVAESAQNAIFFALLAFGFYYYHQLKYFFSETFDDVILDLRVEVLAPVESRVFNACHAVRYVDAGQRFAPFKRLVANARHAVWYVDAGQGFALGKGRVFNACHTVRDVDAGQ